MQFLANAALALTIISSSLLSTTLAAPTQAQMMHTNDWATVESRQCMATCASNDDMQDGSAMIARQIMNRPASEQGDIESRQTMLAMGIDDKDVESRQIHGGVMAETDDTASNQMGDWIANNQPSK